MAHTWAGWIGELIAPEKSSFSLLEVSMLTGLDPAMVLYSALVGGFALGLLLLGRRRS